MRVLIHAGFHKTGTKSVQDMLRQNLAVLAPVLRVAVKEDLADLATLARRYSRDPGPVNSADLDGAIAAFVARIDAADPRPLVISSEDLAGYIPGRHGVQGYPQAADILSRVRDALVAHLGPQTEVIVYLSTRAALPWLYSCHAQHVRHDRMTEDRDSYAARHRDHSDLPAMAADLRKALAPTAVHDVPLEQASRWPLGPVEPVLDLIGLDPRLRAALRVLPAANVSVPTGMLDQMLDMNRSDVPDAILAKAKRALIAKPREDGA